MKTDIKHEGMWWSYIRTCDRCGKLIWGHEWKQSDEPDASETDFCIKCMEYLLDNNISYKDARRQYAKRN